MTEAAYQAARKLMQSINYLRGLITKAKGDLAKWDNIVYELKKNGNSAVKAEAVRDKARLKLRTLQNRFAAMVFPDPNLIAEVKRSTCTICGVELPVGKFTCEECSQTFFPEKKKKGFGG